MKLSIITPYYKTLEYIKKLAKVLEPQLTEEIEWIIVDDGCNELELDKFKAKVIHLKENSGVAGKPRNIGLEMATGEYIAFIDSDDMVSEDYIYEVMKKINKGWDLVYLSWKSQEHNIVITKRPPKWNCAVWCRVYKRSVIGNVRFREDLKIAEDYFFVNALKPHYIKAIEKQIYFYNIRENSLVRSNNG